MVKQKKSQFITLMLTLLIASAVEAKSFKGLVKQKLFSSQLARRLESR